MLVFPRMTAPASRSRVTTVDSIGGRAPARAKDPAVVCILSRVHMVSLMRIGTP
ncbi:hypothetical protein F5144DRAFT_586496 [Chaetomium tenue]|uniref:Uncharacterized protein n=1 Tax=Chaetomium tenue TaxID=1854479 RepID=A0ACB7NVM9_9PEZI|nr:hypothetical protein F5144DRAFT_586496 [Chaetomium globosum]